MPNLKEFQKLIKDIKALQDFKKSEAMAKLLKTTAQTLESVSDESFENKKSPFGEAWKDRAPATKLKLLRERKLSQSDILQVSGHLRRSIGTKTTSNSVILGTNVSKGYAAIHQFGGYAGKNKKVKIPARPYLPINDKGELPQVLEKQIEGFIWKYLGV
ncbi:phage virion morphogenesis protein [Helicobacter sp. 12S02232-10]|uniref:phage virion morphogenesis protein n=1 Tax=Helicobacter sp. 12S02232-10 TaxID=1476197 RepID=UPI000BA755D9|nr:phage virion morphogenesis protein [Helicobacter sp. 12S02232-10]PAF49600.1 phage virion morphogenesis protein [Helicobacter sp. 12S02232-10]